jgi:hypothetical protein
MVEKTIIHKDLADGRWFKLSLREQLGNVGSDVDRAIGWRNKGNMEYSNNAVERALELMYLTIADPKNKGQRLRELCRVRGALIDYFYGDNEMFSTDEWLQEYFFNFAYMVALAKGR